jgi:D-alanyl-D-alanine carboxypeptidase
MCGGHRRKPPSEDNDEEDNTATANGDTSSAQAFMLSSLKATEGKYVLGPPVETEPPVVVFTGPADHPDKVQTPAKAKRHHHKKKAAKHQSKPRKAKVSTAKK